MTKLITDEDLAAVGLELCGDNSCVFGAPGGMGTNGGCRCDGRNEAERWPMSAKTAFKRAAMLARHIAKARAELSAAFLNECSAMEREIATLRADLAASQREVAALRAEAAARPHDLARLADEVKRCQQIITDLCGLHCTGGSADFDSERLGPNNDALRYLAEIGRVEIVSEQGLRVIGRWKP